MGKYEERVDRFLYSELEKEVNRTEDENLIQMFYDQTDLRDDTEVQVASADRIHTALRDGYNVYITQNEPDAIDFLNRYPQMETVHGEWRRMQQGYEPVSQYDLADELAVSAYLSQYDPDLNLSDMTTLFPEQIHEMNRESFEDVCRRFGRDQFQEHGVYATGDVAVDNAFAEFDEDLLADAEARFEQAYEEMAERDDVWLDEDMTLDESEEVVLY